MRTSITSILLLASVWSTAFAATYHGTIRQTVTETNDPQYHVGQTYLGYYQYESPSIDGTFTTPPLYQPPGAIDTLVGSVYMPFASSASFEEGGSTIILTDSPGGHFNGLQDTPNAGVLVITNGQVSDFFWSSDHNGFYMDMTESDFGAVSFYNTPASPIPFTSGTVAFGDPFHVVHVPEEPVTASLLAGVLAVGLVVTWRQRRAAREA